MKIGSTCVKYFSVDIFFISALFLISKKTTGYDLGDIFMDVF